MVVVVVSPNLIADYRTQVLPQLKLGKLPDDTTTTAATASGAVGGERARDSRSSKNKLGLHAAGVNALGPVQLHKLRRD